MMISTNVIHTNIKSVLLLFVLLLATSSLTFGDVQHDVDVDHAAAGAAADSSLNSVVHGSLRLLKAKAAKSNRAKSSKNRKSSKMSKSGGKRAGRPEIELLQDNAFTLQDNTDEPVQINIDWYFSADENTAETAYPLFIRFKVNGLPVHIKPWVDGNDSGSKSIFLDRVGDFNLSVSVYNLDECLESDLIHVTIRDQFNSFWEADSTGTMTFEEAVDWAHEQSKMIETENNDNYDSQVADPITESFFGKIVLSKLGGLGMDKLFGHFGWTGDNTGEKLDTIS